jgi:hypothetical protein
MRAFHLGFLMFLSTLVAGCQTTTTSQTSNAGTASAYQPYLGPLPEQKYFTAELNDAVRDFGRALSGKCSSSANSSSLDACFRKNVVAAMETPDIGTKACENAQPYKNYIQCITLGTFADSLRQRITAAHRPEMSRADWQAPNDYLKRIMKGVTLDIVDTCYAGEMADLAHCSRTEIGHVMEVPDRIEQACDVQKDDQEYGKCLGQGLVALMIREAADRLGATGV